MSNQVNIALNVLQDKFVGCNPHDEDYEGFPIETKIFVEHLAVGDDGIFPNKRSWNAFCNGNFERAGSEGGFWSEGELKDSTVSKWIGKDTLDRIRNNLYVKFNSKLWVEVEPDQVDLKFEYELSGCDADFYPTRVEFTVTATLKASV